MICLPAEMCRFQSPSHRGPRARPLHNSFILSRFFAVVKLKKATIRDLLTNPLNRPTLHQISAQKLAYSHSAQRALTGVGSGHHAVRSNSDRKSTRLNSSHLGISY